MRKALEHGIYSCICGYRCNEIDLLLNHQQYCTVKRNEE